MGTSSILSKDGPLTLAVVGCGTMGSAILSGVLAATSEEHPEDGLQISSLIACVRSERSAKHITSTLSQYSSRLRVLQSGNLEAIQKADIVLLACKPIMRREVLQAEGIREALAGKLLISILAGITTTSLAECLYGEDAHTFEPLKHCYIARAMPNMAAQIRESMTIIALPTSSLPPKLNALIDWIFNQIGHVKSISEPHFDIAAVLVGCSGSLIMLPIDGLLDGCVAEGLRRSDAQAMVTQSVMGNMKLLAAGDHPSLLREKIASPGGCSIRALLKLEAAGVRTAFADAIMEAAFRSRNMA